jgi:hypothetical protein
MKNHKLCCRKCGNESLQISHCHGFKDRLLVWMGRRPARCTKCFRRFHVRAIYAQTLSLPLHAEGCIMPRRHN